MRPREVVERLLEQRFVLRYVPGPNTYIRASTHLFNTEEELGGAGGSHTEVVGVVRERPYRDNRTSTADSMSGTRWSGSACAQPVLGEGAPAYGDAGEARGLRRLHVERGVADVGGLFFRDAAEQFESPQQRLGVGFMLVRVLHRDEAVHDVAQAGEVLRAISTETRRLEVTTATFIPAERRRESDSSTPGNSWIRASWFSSWWLAVGFQQRARPFRRL